MRSRRISICTYLVPIDGSASPEELQSLAAYLSTVGLAGCEVVVVDAAANDALDEKQRVLRWVARHVADSGDILQTAVDVASTEKIIVAAPESRYTAAEIGAICLLLDRYEAVEPSEFVDPMPWWGAIDASRILLHRGFDQERNGGRSFAFRKSAFRPLHGLHENHSDHIERLALLGAEVQSTREIFVRTEPPQLSTWTRVRAREAASSAAVTPETAIFACLIPLLLILGVVGGAQIAGGYAGIVAVASVAIALRGRIGASQFFPLRACLFAPLAIIERSLTVYWSLFTRLRAIPAGAADDIGSAHAPTVPSARNHPAGDSHVR